MVPMPAQKLFSIVCNKHGSKNLNLSTLHNLRITNPLKAFTNFKILQLTENVGPPNRLDETMPVLLNEEPKTVKIEHFINVNVFFSFSRN